MRPSLLLVAATLALTAQASWFGGTTTTDPAYAGWSKSELESWLEVHHVPIPSGTPTQQELRNLVADNWNTVSTWTYDQYDSAQKAFTGLRDSSFDKWDESTLRAWLLERGVVAPKGPREKLVFLAKTKYREYTDAAKSFSAQASASASTAVYGDSREQAVKSASSLGSKATDSAASMASQATSAVAQATDYVGQTFDESKHYVYSTWDEGQMRAWLVEKGVLKSHEQQKKDQLLQMMHNAWGTVANPVYSAWSDSYLHQWLVAHHIIKSDYERNRDDLLNKMNQYYYSTNQSVWSSWTDSQLRAWLIDHGIMKSDAQASRDKMIKMVEDNYLNARDTFWHAWSDNALTQWLTEHGYLRTDAQVKRDQLIKLADEKYNEERARVQSYLTWPDARLRAYLREQGVEEKYLPGDRPGLLQETRIRWVMTQNRAESLYQKIKDLVNSGVYKAEDVLARLVHLLSAGWEDTKDRTSETYGDVKARGSHDWNEAKRQGEQGWDETKRKASEQGDWAKQRGEEVWDETKRRAGEQGERAQDQAQTKTAKLKGEL